METKICTSCGLIKSVDEFHRNSSKKDGLQYYCKDCIRIKYRPNSKAQKENLEYLPKKKICKECCQLKLQSEFNFHSKSRDGLVPWCKKCQKLLQLKRKYGITSIEYNILLEKQNGVCAICHQPETAKHQNGILRSLAVDHNHTTGKIRGLLCQNCNNMLGNAKDNPQTLRDGANYVEEQQ